MVNFLQQNRHNSTHTSPMRMSYGVSFVRVISNTHSQGSTLTRARVPGAHKFCGRARELLNSRARPGKCFFRTVKQFAAMSLVVCRLPASRALKTKEISVTVSAHVIHYGISDGSNTSLITFPTWCDCVNPIVIDLIDVKFCDLSRNGGCLHPDYHNVSHQNVTLPSRRKVADTI